ncbi:P-loop containing nucleoside triphosphate hydrolase protein [Xylariaceae sp. FL0594]|nr:P-loop containing nucleoside triphosphate hydrolase protein [Xylariaceae sp. FL0594]
MSAPGWNYIAKLVCIGDSGCGKSSLTIRLCEGRFSPHHDVTIGVEFGSRIVPVGPPHSKKTSESHRPSSSTATDDVSSSISRPAGAGNNSNSNGNKGAAAAEEEQKHMKLSLWDTAGQEQYKSVTRSYFRGASGALLVFDITRRATFVHATDWLNDLRAIAEPDIVVILVGNKLDCVQSSSLSEEEEEETGDSSTSRSKSDKREVTFAEASEWARQNNVLQYVETSAKSGENVEAAFMRVAERIFENINAGKYDLNDRRSGVKGPGPGTAGALQNGSIRLSSANEKSSTGRCC